MPLKMPNNKLVDGINPYICNSNPRKNTHYCGFLFDRIEGIKQFYVEFANDL